MRKVIKYVYGHKKTLIGGLLGFALFWLSSHPESPVKKRLPERNIKNVDYIPNVKIRGRESHYHVHHWMILSSIYAVTTLLKRRVLKSSILHGFLLGGIIQGLTYKDRFRVKKHPSKD
jgi:hypothetical protein